MNKDSLRKDVFIFTLNRPYFLLGKLVLNGVPPIYYEIYHFYRNVLKNVQIPDEYFSSFRHIKS